MRYAQRVQTTKDYETQFLDQHNVEWRYWEKINYFKKNSSQLRLICKIHEPSPDTGITPYK